MIKLNGSTIAAIASLALAPLTTAGAANAPLAPLPQLSVFPDSAGQFATFNVAGPIDTGNAFFQDLGTNGRSCVTCHQPADAWTVTPAHVRNRFAATAGRDPIFRTNDGANCPSADVSTLAARRRAYSLLLNKGLIRIEMAVPANAEFSVIQVNNPYGCTDPGALSMYRRPLPTASVADLSTVMWDGRETFAGKSVYEDLGHQAVDATLGHAQAAQAPSADQVKAIVDFELQLFTAQVRDSAAGSLSALGANGGPVALSQQDFYLGINDPLGLNPAQTPFDARVFDIFNAWAVNTGTGDRAEARQAIVRGQQLFNTLPITITGVGGLNDVALPFDGQVHPSIAGTCGTCHDAPNVGDHSLPAPLNIGLTDAARRTPDLPLITLMNTLTGETVQTSDPGRAMVTGKWADIGKFKGPILRGLAGRAPYFHNGSAATLGDVLDFYNTRFNLNLSTRQRSDLIAFLNTL
jgi:cytochrome c peroxidase